MTVIDRRRFERMYAANYDTVLRYCLRRTTHEDAMDAAAETFAVAWRRRDALPWDRPLPWLYGVACKVLGNQRRSAFRQRRVAARIGGQGDPDYPGPELVVVQAVEEGQLLEALAALRPHDREVIRLAAWEELNRDELAAALDCSANAVTKRLNRALDRLAEELGTAGRGGQRFFRRERSTA